MRLSIHNASDVPPGKAQAARIQDAIDQVHRNGGGIVSLGAGLYVSTTIFLRSGVELHLERGAVVQAWPVMGDYPAAPVAADNKDQSVAHLVAGFDCQGIAITGDGVIDGQDEAFWEPCRTREERPYGIFRFTVRNGPRNRPSPLVQLVRCSDVQLREITVRAAPGWAVHVFDCDRVSIVDMKVRGHPYGPNTDGIGINGSRDVRITHCDVDTGDDAIIIKATNHDSVCRNVVVSDCIVASNCAGLGLGADVYGQISDVIFSNCVVKKSLRMIQIEMWFPGQVERAIFSGITGRTLPDPEVENERPIYVDIQRHATSTGGFGKVRDIVFRDVLCQSRGRIMLTAQDGARLEDIRLDHVVVDVPDIEDPAVTVPKATSMQLSNGNPLTRAVRAAVVADNVHRLTLRDVQYRWPALASVPMQGLCCRRTPQLVDKSPLLMASCETIQRTVGME